MRSNDGGLCISLHAGVHVGANHCGTMPNPATLVLPHGLTVQVAGVGKDSCTLMHGRVRGDGRVGTHGEWECAVCHMEGCWRLRRDAPGATIPQNEVHPGQNTRLPCGRCQLQRVPRNTALLKPHNSPASRCPTDTTPRAKRDATAAATTTAPATGGPSG